MSENVDKLVSDDTQLSLATQALKAVETSEDRKDTKTPVDIVEGSVADFLGKAIDATLYSTKLSQALEDDLISDLPSMSTSEKITLFNIDRSSANDRLFKMLSPTIGLISARQQAMIQAAGKAEAAQQAAAVQVNIGAASGGLDANVAANTPQEVKAGLNAIFQLIASRSANLKQAEEVKPEE